MNHLWHSEQLASPVFASFCALCGFSTLRQCSIGLGRIIHYFYPTLNRYYIAFMH